MIHNSKTWYTSYMATYVPDINTKRWVIISPARKNRPDSSHTDTLAPHACPFCAGNEHLTPPEISRITNHESRSMDKTTTTEDPMIHNSSFSIPDSQWSVRVIPNKYPITDMHEVIIHSPDHEKDIADLPEEHVRSIFTMYQERFIAHEKDGHVMIFCNHGKEGGASLAHPHSQLVVVPHHVPFDALSKEPVTNIVTETDSFTVYCPDFSEWPYELWFAPKHANRSFAQSTPEELTELSTLLPSSTRALQQIFETSFKNSNYSHQFSYNYYISHDSDFFIRLIPRFAYRAGFEFGSGLLVNIADPKQAAESLKPFFLK